LNGSRSASAKLRIAATPNSAAPAEKAIPKRSTSGRRARASKVPLAPNPRSAMLMIM
jgi:hypothetical protein